MSDDADKIFDAFLEKIAKEIDEDGVDKLGRELGFKLAQRSRFEEENARKVTHIGTLKMLRKWNQGQNKTNRRGNLKAAVEKAGLDLVKDNYFSDDDVEQHTRRTPPASIVQGANSQSPREKDDEEVEPDGDGNYTQTMKQAYPSQGQLDPKKNYKMDALTKGHMFIFNMRKDRRGSGVDVRNVKHVFEEIGYEMKIYSDLTAEDLRDKLRKFVDSPDHNGMSSVVFLLMGHGTKKGTGIKCKLGDKDVVSTKFVMEQVSRMKSMDGKPKMVFFQCCRGKGKGKKVETGQDATDKAIPAKSNVSTDDSTTDEDTGTEEETDDDESDLSIPADSDVFKINATKHGNKAYRSRAKGTWFIHTLCKVLLENAHVSDLSTMLEQVTGDVGEMGSKKKAQVLEVVKQGVSKKMYFLPKYRPSKA